VHRCTSALLCMLCPLLRMLCLLTCARLAAAIGSSLNCSSTAGFGGAPRVRRRQASNDDVMMGLAGQRKGTGREVHDQVLCMQLQ